MHETLDFYVNSYDISLANEIKFFYLESFNLQMYAVISGGIFFSGPQGWTSIKESVNDELIYIVSFYSDDKNELLKSVIFEVDSGVDKMIDIVTNG